MLRGGDRLHSGKHPQGINATKRKRSRRCRRKYGGVVVVGNLWGRNFGDDIMLLGLVSLHANDRIVVLCQQKAERLRALGIMAEPLSFQSFYSAVLAGYRVMVPGGTHLEFVLDRSRKIQYRVLCSWLILGLIARVGGAGSEMVSVGIGPLRTPLSRRLAVAVCKCQDKISVRDANTQGLLSGWGIAADLVDDLALPFVRRWRNEIRGARRNAAGEEYLIAAPAFARYDVTWWLDQLEKLSAETGVQNVVFIASGRQSGGDDAVAVSEIARRTQSIGIKTQETYVYSGDAMEVLRLIEGATAVVAARYHIVLAARALGKCVVADVYHPKVIEAMKVEPVE